MRTDRLNQMEAFILRNGTASLYELSQYFDISLNTVRRDVADLIKRGRISKVYGGVSSARAAESQSFATPLPVTERAELNADEKRAIGRLAASLVEEGSVIYMDSGTTVPYMLPHLAGKRVKIFTHSLSVLTEAAMYPSIEVMGIGGRLNATTYSLTGEAGFLCRNIRLHALFMAATALSVEWGASNNTYEEYRLKSELVSAHDNVFVLADHSKIGKNATYCYCPITRIRGIVTDQKPPAPFADTLRQHGIALYCAEDEAK